MPALLHHNAWTAPDAFQARWAIRSVATCRARRVLLFLSAVWMLNAFDLTMTLRAQADGMLHEGNPLAKYVMQHGAPALTAFKLALLCGASIVLVRFRQRRIAELASCLVLAIYVGVAFQWKFCYDMYEIINTGASAAEDFGWADAQMRYLPML